MEITNQPQPKNNYASVILAFNQDLMDMLETANKIGISEGDNKKKLTTKLIIIKLILGTIERTQANLMNFINDYYKFIEETGNELDYKEYTNGIARKHFKELINELNTKQ